MEKSSPGRRVTYLPKLPWANQLFLHFLAKLAKPFTREKKVGSAFDCRVTLLAGQTFLHINTLARTAGSTLSRRDNQSMHERCWLGQRGQFFLT